MPALGWTLLLLAVIVIPLFVGIELIKDAGWLERLFGGAGGRMERRFLRPLGMTYRAGVPMAAGLVFGLAYGAGVILDSAREGGLPGRERLLLTAFLVACHAVIEDTLLFVPLGVNPLFLLLFRFAGAVILTGILARWVEQKAAQPVGASPVPKRSRSGK